MAAPTSLTQLRIVHLALVASSVVVPGVVWWARVMPGAAPPVSAATGSILYVGLSVGILALLVGIAAWRGIPAYEPAAELTQWLRTTAPRMVVTWGLCEGAAVIAAITYFVTGDTIVCGALAAAAVIGVIVHSPGKLAAS
ncbi:MAG: hypothetical protein ACHQXA_08050 [Gemmatimonadales bacterium]